MEIKGDERDTKRNVLQVIHEAVKKGKYGNLKHFVLISRVYLYRWVVISNSIFDWLMMALTMVPFFFLIHLYLSFLAFSS